MYFNFYYLFAKFTRKVNNRNNDFAFLAILNFGVILGMSIILVLYFLLGKIAFKSNITFLILLTTLSTFAIQYFALIKDKKYIRIVEEKDANFQKNIKYYFYLIALVIYVIVLFCTVFYLGNMNRNSLN